MFVANSQATILYFFSFILSHIIWKRGELTVHWYNHNLFISCNLFLFKMEINVRLRFFYMREWILPPITFYFSFLFAKIVKMSRTTKFFANFFSFFFKFSAFYTDTHGNLTQKAHKSHKLLVLMYLWHLILYETCYLTSFLSFLFDSS